MNYPLCVFLGLIPSIIWLLLYLRQDVHPEPKKTVLKIFFWGALATIPAVVLEMGVIKGLGKLNIPSIFISILYWFIGIALVEEALKYLVVKGQVLRDPEFDEPVDAMLYMIIAALGFAAVENILVLFSESSFFIRIIVFRFLGAVLLHTLSSGTLGYFLALSFFESKKRLKLLVLGFGLAVILHGFFNYSIMKIHDAIISGEGNLVLFWFRILIIFLIGLAVLIFLGFRKLKKIKSVCEIKIK